MGQATVLGMAESLPSPNSWYWSLGDQAPQSLEGTGGISSLTASTVEPLLRLFQPFPKILPHTFLSPYLAPPWPRAVEPHPYNSGLALPCHCPEVGKSLETGFGGFPLHLAFSLHTCETDKLLGFLTVRSNLKDLPRNSLHPSVHLEWCRRTRNGGGGNTG